MARRTTFAYSPINQVTNRQDARGRMTTFTYDEVGSQTLREYRDGGRVTTTYDTLSRRTVLADSTGRYTTSYDAVGQVTTLSWPGNKTLTYSYNGNGQRTSLIDPDGGRFTYSYDPVGRIELLDNPQSDRTTFAYDGADRRTSIRRANCTRTSYIYSTANETTKIEHRNPSGTLLSSFAYTYDQTGNRTLVQELTGVPVTYTYDETNQLINEYRFNSYSGTMTYDGVGNRTVFNDSGQPTTYTYDGADQLTSSLNIGTTTNYTNDENGNLLTQVTGTSRTTQTWDDENRLTKWELKGSTTNDYAFNGDGQRTRIVDSVTPSGRRLIWDEQNILLETDDEGATQATYTLEPAGYGNLISQRRSTTNSYYLFDALGSTDRLMDSAGTTALNTYQYRASGIISSSTGSTVNPFRWIGAVGYYYDANRTAYYVRARTYSPGLMRWLSRDPIGLRGGDGNLYRYVSNSLVLLVDPSGNVCLAPKCEGGCVAGKATKLKSCEITKLEILDGSDFSCKVVTENRICDTLEKWIDAENKKFGDKEWLYDECSEGCECEDYKLDDTKKELVLKDQIIARTESTFLGDVHCIFKVSGKVILTGGALAIVSCKLKKPLEFIRSAWRSIIQNSHSLQPRFRCLTNSIGFFMQPWYLLWLS